MWLQSIIVVVCTRFSYCSYCFNGLIPCVRLLTVRNICSGGAAVTWSLPFIKYLPAHSQRSTVSHCTGDHTKIIFAFTVELIWYNRETTQLAVYLKKCRFVFCQSKNKCIIFFSSQKMCNVVEKVICVYKRSHTFSWFNVRNTLVLSLLNYLAHIKLIAFMQGSFVLTCYV